jgi:rubrerythrin
MRATAFLRTGLSQNHGGRPCLGNFHRGSSQVNDTKSNGGQARREVLAAAWRVLTAIPVVGAFGVSPVLAVGRYDKTVETLRRAAKGEMAAFRRYRTFSRKAHQEGYKGVSYLFAALAASELIHAQYYNRVLARLGADVVPHGNGGPADNGTKKNLIAAAKAELKSINVSYPSYLKAVQVEGHPEAMNAVKYAWASHKQHIELINKIRKYAPALFEIVARRIDKVTDILYVCEICGSTTAKVPARVCPVCGQPAHHYRKIEPITVMR